jgi:hypothetical protein
MPVVLDDESEPEPDICVVAGDPRDYREPAPDAAAPFGWRYGHIVTLGPDECVAPLGHPERARHRGRSPAMRSVTRERPPAFDASIRHEISLCRNGGWHDSC